MMEDLNRNILNVNLKLNKKTKVMCNSYAQIIQTVIQDEALETAN